jgi:phage shock protein B
MHGAVILATIFGGTILVLAIIGSTILMGIKILKGGVSRTGQKMQSDEARVIQEIYQGLSRMEKRVEALETLILDHERKEREP